MQIIKDNLSGRKIADFLEEHIKEMKAISPPESKHALDLDGLRKPEITFWTVWDEDHLIGCGALKELDSHHGEIKSMRTSASHRRQGIASFLIRHIVDEATSRGYRRLSLETGAMPFFQPARQLYASFGFQICGPFSLYKEDPNSIFMTKKLEAVWDDEVKVTE
jgi:putative acetyltransferase